MLATRAALQTQLLLTSRVERRIYSWILLILRALVKAVYILFTHKADENYALDLAEDK